MARRLQLAHKALVDSLVGHAEKYCLRGNVLWILYKDRIGDYQVEAYLITRDYRGWASASIDYSGSTYYTCPLSYLEKELAENRSARQNEWVEKLREHYKELGKKRRKYNRDRKNIQLGDIIKLGYRNLPKGMVINLKPLTVMNDGQTYSNIEMKVFKGWIVRAGEVPRGTESGA